MVSDENLAGITERSRAKKILVVSGGCAANDSTMTRPSWRNNTRVQGSTAFLTFLMYISGTSMQPSGESSLGVKMTLWSDSSRRPSIDAVYRCSPFFSMNTGLLEASSSAYELSPWAVGSELLICSSDASLLEARDVENICRLFFLDRNTFLASSWYSRQTYEHRHTMVSPGSRLTSCQEDPLSSSACTEILGSDVSGKRSKVPPRLIIIAALGDRGIAVADRFMADSSDSSSSKSSRLAITLRRWLAVSISSAELDADIFIWTPYESLLLVRRGGVGGILDC